MNTSRCLRESLGRFITTIFMQEFPDIESANARSFSLDLAEEIITSGNMDTEKEPNRRIRIEWPSMALIYLYNETRTDETIPISIDDRYYKIRKKR